MGDWSGVVGSHERGGLNTSQEITLPNGPICALDAVLQSLAISMDKITSQSCGELHPGDFSLTATRANQR